MTAEEQAVDTLLKDLPSGWGWFVCTFPMNDLTKSNTATNIDDQSVVKLAKEIHFKAVERMIK